MYASTPRKLYLVVNRRHFYYRGLISVKTIHMYLVSVWSSLHNTGTTVLSSTVVPLLKVTLTRGHPSYEARIFCPHYYKVNRFLPLAKGHLSYVATMCSQIGWPYKRGTTVIDKVQVQA